MEENIIIESAETEVVETTETVGYGTERPFLDTPFTDYNVTEGLLLLVLVCVVVGALVKLLMGVFD